MRAVCPICHYRTTNSSVCFTSDCPTFSSMLKVDKSLFRRKSRNCRRGKPPPRIADPDTRQLSLPRNESGGQRTHPWSIGPITRSSWLHQSHVRLLSGFDVNQAVVVKSLVRPNIGVFDGCTGYATDHELNPHTKEPDMNGINIFLSHWQDVAQHWRDIAAS